PVVLLAAAVVVVVAEPKPNGVDEDDLNEKPGVSSPHKHKSKSQTRGCSQDTKLSRFIFESVLSVSVCASAASSSSARSASSSSSAPALPYLVFVCPRLPLLLANGTRLTSQTPLLKSESGVWCLEVCVLVERWTTEASLENLDWIENEARANFHQRGILLNNLRSSKRGGVSALKPLRMTHREREPSPDNPVVDDGKAEDVIHEGLTLGMVPRGREDLQHKSIGSHHRVFEKNLNITDGLEHPREKQQLLSNHHESGPDRIEGEQRSGALQTVPGHLQLRQQSPAGEHWRTQQHLADPTLYDALPRELKCKIHDKRVIHQMSGPEVDPPGGEHQNPLTVRPLALDTRTNSLKAPERRLEYGARRVLLTVLTGLSTVNTSPRGSSPLSFSPLFPALTFSHIFAIFASFPNDFCAARFPLGREREKTHLQKMLVIALSSISQNIKHNKSGLRLTSARTHAHSSQGKTLSSTHTPSPLAPLSSEEINLCVCVCVLCFRRPEKVCLCPFLPALPLDISTRLYIVQHPAEESRVLRTVPLLAACLPPDRCRVIVGRRFSEERFPELAAVCKDSRTLLLYPGATAENLEELRLDSDPPHSLILIDGTWSQAKDIYGRNALLQRARQVQLRSASCSQYVIRTQPSDSCVSTLECAAVALAALEKNDSIREVLLRPLQALCSFQLQHGAQVHHSKEHQLTHGQYRKPLPRNKRKIRRLHKLISSQSPEETSEPH
ncbi:hypothetical protein DNTS_009420, partial [Danionella cerebrum]